VSERLSRETSAEKRPSAELDCGQTDPVDGDAVTENRCLIKASFPASTTSRASPPRGSQSLDPPMD
jgi:hypothetical protein